MFFLREADPLDSVSKDRNRRIVHLGPFHRPTGVADHDLVEGEAFLGPSDEDVPRQLWHGEHHTGFANEHFSRGLLEHNPGAPGHGSILTEAAFENDSEIADPPLREERELFFAF